MLFTIHASDKEDSLELRMKTRENHLQYLSNAPLVYAGPLLDENGNMCGSLVVLDMKEISEVRKFVENDPYSKAGLFQKVEIHRFTEAFSHKGK